MFLTFAVIGAWQTVLAQHLKELGFTGIQQGAIIGTGALAAMITPILAGQIADRWFPTERFLGLTNLATGVVLLLAYGQDSFEALWILMFANGLFYVTTIPLGTSLSFHHLPDPPRQFPVVRAWGTIGWIVAAGAFAAWLHLTGRSLRDCLAMGGILALANGLYSFTLPHTPPDRTAVRKFALGKVLSMLRDPSFVVFTVLLFAMQIFFGFYNVRAAIFYVDLGVGRENLSLVMGVGQIMEIAVLLLLPRLYAKTGAKTVLALGIAAWVVRFGIYSLMAPLWLMIAAQVLHGPGFGLMRIGASLYIDRIAARDVRASAQSFLSSFVDGSGMFVGGIVAGVVVDKVATGWVDYWWIAGAGTAVILVAFLAGFKARDGGAPEKSPPAG